MFEVNCIFKWFEVAFLNMYVFEKKSCFSYM